jgi:hypothetical protein
VELKAADIRNVILAGFAISVAAVISPSLEAVGIPLAALGLGWFAFRFGMRSAVLTALAATAVVAIVTAGQALSDGTVGVALTSLLFVGPALLAAGPGTAWALERRRAVTVVAGLTAVLFVLAVAMMSLQAGLAHTTVTAELQAVVRAAIAQAVVQAKSQPGGAAQAQQVAALQSTWLSQVQLWPSLQFVISAFTAAVSVPVVSWVGRRLGRPVSALPALADLDLSFHLVWPGIVGIAALAWATFTKQPPAGWAWVVGANLLFAVRPAFYLQGMGVFAALYKRLGTGRFGRGFGFALLTISEILIPSVSVAGAADLFFNLRKLPRDGMARQIDV